MIFWPRFAVLRKTGLKSRPPKIHPTIRTCISVPTRKRSGSGKVSKRMPGYKMTFNVFTCPDEARMRKVSLTKSKRAPANRAPGFDTMVEGTNA